MASITSPGLGSGLDVNSIVSQLIEAEAQAPTRRLDVREAALQVRLSAYGTLKGAVSQFQDTISNLQDLSSFRAKSATAGDSDVLDATVNSSAVPANYNLDVTQLADRHSLSTDPTTNVNAQFTEVTDVLGTGTLTFRFGTTDYTAGTDTYNSFTPNSEKASKSITITDGSLQGIRDAVNDADIGVTAAIIFDGSYQRLTFSSNDSGAANSLQVITADADGNDTDAAGLSLLAFNDASGGTTHLAQNVAAQDAIFTVNGINITSESNEVKNVLDGVTLDLKKVGSSSVDVAIDSGAASRAINSFVVDYNALIGSINSLTSYDPETQEAGQLNGDGVVRSITIQLKRLLGDPLNTDSGAFNILADVGITSNAQTGLLEIDNEKLSSAIESNVDDLIGLFAAYGRPTDNRIIFDSATENTKEGSYAVSIDSFATKGSLVGSAAANLTITSGTNDKINIDVDGISAAITLTAGTYTASTLIAELQSQINEVEELSEAGSAVTVSESAGVLSITSNRYGSTSEVTISGGNGRTGLFGASETSTAGEDVAGSIGGVSATGSGQYLTGAEAATGLKIKIDGGALGDRGTVSFARGFAERFDGYLDGLLDRKGIFDSTIDSLKSRIEGIGDERENLARRLEAIEKRTRAQFLALDVLVSQLQNTGSFLTQQLDSLPVIGARSTSNRS